MDYSVPSHPQNAAQAMSFVSQGSLQYPYVTGVELAPPSYMATQPGAPSPSTTATPESQPATSDSNSATPEEASATPAYNPASGITSTIQNVVATVTLGTRLELKTIALQARNAEYNPKRFAAVIMRIREPKTTALVFASGKMVVTGAKSEDLARLAARKFARIIQKLGFTATFKDFKIQNIVASCDVKFRVRLEGIASTHHRFSTYEPELFPGLIYRMMKPKVVMLIFVSGKVVITGAKVREDIYQSFELMYPVLTDFRT